MNYTLLLCLGNAETFLQHGEMKGQLHIYIYKNPKLLLD